MKSTDIWKSLPTPAELMESPRVRSVIDRLNPTVVTARVRGFLDEVRSEVSQRADNAGLPSLGELADRVSRYLAGDGSYRVGGAINATGRFHGLPWLSTPLAEAAIEQVLLTAQDYSAGCADAPSATDSDAVERLTVRTGAEHATVLSSHACAMELVLRTLPSPKRVVIARGEVASIESGCRLTDLAAAAGATLCEVGAVDQVTLEDYASALRDTPGVVLRMAASSSGGSVDRPPVADLAELAKQHQTELIVECGAAAIDNVHGLALTTPTVCEAVGAGAQLALVRGDGLIGGPGCGIVVGRSAAVQRVTASPLSAAYKIDAMRAAALAATLDLLSDAEKSRLSVPVLALATAPLDNLRTRAERLAPLVAQSRLVSNAEPVEASLGGSPGLPLDSASWAIRITPAEGGAQPLLHALLKNTPPIRCVDDPAGPLLDLRTVFPRQDLALAAFFSDPPREDPADDAACTTDEPTQ